MGRREGGRHDHGEPFAWDPRAAERRRGVRFVWLGLALIAVGALVLWLASAAAAR
jgi:hypothetical protein